MTVSKAAKQITWPTAANTASVSSGSNATSEAFTFESDSFAAMVLVKADNAGTPASGDTLDVYILFTTGDPDAEADSADEYDTSGHGTFLMQLDTNVDDPAIKTVSVPPAAKGAKLYVENNASSNSMTVSAQMYEASA